MRARVISIGSQSRKEVPSAMEEKHDDGFCKAVMTIKSLLKCSPLEVVVAVNNLLAAGFLTQKQVRMLGHLYEWDLGQ